MKFRVSGFREGFKAFRGFSVQGLLFCGFGGLGDMYALEAQQP